jgi:SAM-dependent methyltransferase
MDELARFNQERWNALVKANVAYSRPFLNLDDGSARKEVDPHDLLGPLAGKEVLCLAGGGGQQSAAFAFLGSRVTVFDLSDSQLDRDRQAAAHYGFELRIEHGDMRDLTRFGDRSFDIISQPYSINFVPDPLVVIGEAARVLRPGGIYQLDIANPFTFGMDERNWDGEAYQISHLYQDGEVTFDDPDWIVCSEDAPEVRVKGPREFRHTLSTLFNGLASAGFRLLRLEEEPGDPQAEPGSWEHFMAVVPPWLHTWWQLGERSV